MPIALTTAPGALGCSDRNARTTKTNGRRHNPNAISGPAFGVARPSSEPSDTRADTIAQYAGMNRSVASVIARHFRCGESGAAPARMDRRARCTTISP